MERNCLSRAGKHILSPVVLGCLWAFAVPSDSWAADPAVSNPVCYVQSVKQQGQQTLWQIKGTATVGNLSPGSNVRVTFTFETKANGAESWSTLFTVQQTGSSNNGTASLNTDFQRLNSAPAKGDQYRISVSGTWATEKPPVMKGNLESISSQPIIPIP